MFAAHTRHRRQTSLTGPEKGNGKRGSNHEIT